MTLSDTSLPAAQPAARSPHSLHNPPGASAAAMAHHNGTPPGTPPPLRKEQQHIQAQQQQQQQRRRCGLLKTRQTRPLLLGHCLLLPVPTPTGAASPCRCGPMRCVCVRVCCKRVNVVGCMCVNMTCICVYEWTWCACVYVCACVYACVRVIFIHI